MNACEADFVLPVTPRRGYRRSIDLRRAYELIGAGYSIRSIARRLRVPRSTLRWQLARAADADAIERAADRELALRVKAHAAVPVFEARHQARVDRAAERERDAMWSNVFFVGEIPPEWHRDFPGYEVLGIYPPGHPLRLREGSKRVEKGAS